MSKRTFDDFNEYASNYRAIHSQNVKLTGADSFYFAEHKVNELKNYEKTDSINMLDVGCGDGMTEVYVQQYFPSWTAEGIDIAAQSIAEANDRNLNNANFNVFNGTDIPFADNCFDIVFVAAVLHHVDFSLHEKILNEIYRVLKPGGRLYLFEHNPINPATKYLVKTCVFDKDARLLGYKYAKRILKAALFSSFKRKFILFFPRWKIFKPFFKIENLLGWLPLGGQYYYRAVK